MQLNLMAIALATVAQFGMGFVWYGPLFGNLWGKIHGFDKLPKATQEKMMKQMGPYYLLQLLVTLATSIALSMIIPLVSEWSIFMLAFVLWFGFSMPVQVSSVIFGGTEGKWMWPKILVQIGGSLACLLVAALVLRFF